ncbi:MAG: DHH family phosphoesterase, partial [Rhabdochlamydiaceae bacterium]
MEDEQGLLDKAHQFESKIAASSKNNENILVASHHDADGICAAAILSEFIFRNKGHCQIRTVSEPNSKFLDKLSSSKFDQIVFVDICSGLSEEISKRFGDKWLVIDHHEMQRSEMNHDCILNPEQFGFDGSKSASASTLCYLVAKTRHERLAFMALVGSLGDRQDVGPRRSLVGLNAKVLGSDNQDFKGIDSKFDLLFSSRETKPVHESIATTLSVFIPGLTGNKDACLASLRGAGIEIKASTRWKTVSDFSEEEKQKLLEAIVPHLSGTTYTVEDLVGSVYSLNSRDEFSMTRDARDLALVLSACGRMGKSGVAFSICMGDEGLLSNEVEQILADYRMELMRSLQTLLQSEDRISERGTYSLIVGDGLVSEKMTGSVCQIISSYSRFRSKVVFVRTTTQDGDVKLSARCGKEIQDCDLGSMLSKIAAETSGVGGGL